MIELLIIFAFILVITIVVIIISGKKKVNTTRQEHANAAHPQETVPQHITQEVMQEEEKESDDESVATNSTIGLGFSGNAPVIDPDKKYTKKEMLKMQKKKAKADEREAREEYLKMKKEKEQEAEKAYQLKEMKRKEIEAKEEEIIKKMREEKEKKESEEYALLEKTFTIKEEGTEKFEFNESVISEFIKYIKIRKVVEIEDLAGTFKLSSAEAVQKLQDLESLGRISGIIDDRGKYVFLTEKELMVSFNLFNQ